MTCHFQLSGSQGFGDAFVTDDAKLLGLDWMEQSDAMRGALDVLGYVRSVKVKDEIDISEVLRDRFPNVFADGLGCCRKEKASLELKPNAKSIFRKSRPVPYAATEVVEQELERLKSLEVIEPVNHSDWAAPIVVVSKKDSGKVRVCSDFSTGLNDSLKDHDYPLPVPDDIFASLNGGTVFSQIDFKDAYLQVEIAPESRHLVTINTHKGLFQYKRLPFGVKTAPAIFQSIMHKMCAGLSGVTSYLDDIIVKGDSKEEHDRNLLALFERINDYGFRVRLDKCSFNKPEIKFLGYIVDSKGRRPDPAKIDALISMDIPKNLAQLRSFLGMVSYYGNFLPQVKRLRGPLDELTRKDVKFIWDAKKQAAFDALLKILGSDLNLTHFNPKLPIFVASDASEYGIGAVVYHRFPDGSEKPIHHVSRALTPSERNYSQIEKEALGIVVAVKKFHKYIYGRKFCLKTDHKPLLTIFGSKKGIPAHQANRLLRWGLILLGYDFDIEYVNTLDFGNADALSRLMSKVSLENEDKVIAQIEQEVQRDFHSCIRKLPVTSSDVSKETAEDPILKTVIARHLKGNWPDKPKSLPPEILPFFERRTQLSMVNNCLMVNENVVIPTSLRLKVLRELHNGHPGIVRMKQLARNFVFWPGIDKDIESFVSKCSACLENLKTPTKVPLKPWPIPSQVWERVHIDFAGPVDGNFYFVIVDALSKWPEIFILKNITARLTVKTLENVFSKYGYPKMIVSDNGTQFTSVEFREMCLLNGINHVKTAPYHPQSNGQAERFVDTLKRGLKKLKGEGGCPEFALQKLLFAYRSTPSSTLKNKAPSEIFLGRKIRSRLNLLIPEKPNKNLVSEETKAELYFNSKHGTVERKFSVGDTVQVKRYAPNHWFWKTGLILEKLGQVNYLVEFDGKTSKFHANQMRLVKEKVKVSQNNPDLWLNEMLYTFDLKPNDPVAPPPCQADQEEDDGPPQADGPVAAPIPAPDAPPDAAAPVPPTPPAPRRSTRNRRPPTRFSP